MPLSPSSPSRRSAGAVALALCGAIALGFGLASPEALIEKSFTRALGTAADENAHPQTAQSVPFAGSEEFWLRTVRHDGPAPLSGPVAVGDEVTITSGGVARTLRVADVEELGGGAITRIDTSERPSRLLLVTCRDAANPAARPIRFVIEAEQPAPQLLGPKPARVL